MMKDFFLNSLLNTNSWSFPFKLGWLIHISFNCNRATSLSLPLLPPRLRRRRGDIKCFRELQEMSVPLTALPGNFQICLMLVAELAAAPSSIMSGLYSKNMTPHSSKTHWNEVCAFFLIWSSESILPCAEMRDLGASLNSRFLSIQ